MTRDAFAYPPRGMDRIEAARYVSASPTLFDEMVKDGRMPKPRTMNSRVVWDRIALDAAFSNLPEREGNAIDRILAKAHANA